MAVVNLQLLPRFILIFLINFPLFLPFFHVVCTIVPCAVYRGTPFCVNMPLVQTSTDVWRAGIYVFCLYRLVQTCAMNWYSCGIPMGILIFHVSRDFLISNNFVEFDVT